MCEPTTIAMLAISVASAGAQLKGQIDQGKAQKQYQNSLDLETNRVANTQLSQLAIRRSQENEATATEKLRASREATLQASTARVATAESGVSGNSASQLLRDYTQQQGLYTAALDRQLTITSSSLKSQGDAVLTQAGYDKTAAARPIAGPDYFGAAAKIGAAGLNAYDAHSDYLAKKEQ